MKRFLLRLLRGGMAVFALVTLVACALHVTNSDSDVSVQAPEGDALRIASYNVHYIILGQETGAWSVGDWDRRKAPLDKAFKALRADIVAFQEMESFQRGSDGSVNLARDYLLDQNSEYSVTATGDWREFPSTQPFFYLKKRLQPLEQGWFFFSETPDVIYSRTFNGSYPAFASWARFEDRDTGDRFRVVNVHFEYSSRSNRRLSAELVRDRLTPWTEAGETVFLVGDLNALHGSRTMDILEESGVRFDQTPGATYYLNRGVHLIGAIDHLSRTPDVDLAAGPVVLQEKFDGEWPSDHHPVYADYLLPSAQK
ncbi:endonuclease/exonuclease/phosphatase family protein [Marivita geojedonensis]|uniref:Endonuclease n=1 Tax=Marivita geojedonensis TaxID=1123756 RepID=A0A1X4NNA2_9RHOB|nr:endonuclease/exonuclease/phosphatase family protein [Marivita geojedonensis]OSQ52000.1 endonuclease [Marivita geojedonensis]PRY81250.1 endonuclease/exonuclease/phosphatase family metal-dependent hydrolase [Marivita geojedonensis]